MEKATEMVHFDADIQWSKVNFEEKKDLRSRIQDALDKPVPIDVINWRMGRAMKKIKKIRGELLLL